ncbi:hypothetical protein MTO96_023698 [Rhipicephalus appendiculatus]
MSRLLAVRPVHNLQDTERLRTLYDELQTGVRSLEALGVASSTYGVLLLTVLGKSFLDYDSLSTVLTQAEAAHCLDGEKLCCGLIQRPDHTTGPSQSLVSVQSVANLLDILRDLHPIKTALTATQRRGKAAVIEGTSHRRRRRHSPPKAVTATDGHAKPPDGFIPKVQPTPEQIRLAQIINDPTKQDDPDIKNKVQQVMEVTGQSSDAVVIALHDCDNDPTRAITMLIEGNKQEGEWETRGKKKKPVKEGNQQQQQQQKGDQGGPASSNKENRKNKEIEKNERNLEDGRTGERTGDMRPRGGSRRGGRGGRGGGVGGGRG